MQCKASQCNKQTSCNPRSSKIQPIDALSKLHTYNALMCHLIKTTHNIFKTRRHALTTNLV